MNICDLNVLCERTSQLYVYTHMYDDLVNREALKGILKCTVSYMMLPIFYVHVKGFLP